MAKLHLFGKQTRIPVGEEWEKKAEECVKWSLQSQAKAYELNPVGKGNPFQALQQGGPQDDTGILNKLQSVLIEDSSKEKRCSRQPTRKLTILT